MCFDTGETVSNGSGRHNRLVIVDRPQRITSLVALLKTVEIMLAEGTSSNQDEAASLRSWITEGGGNSINGGKRGTYGAYVGCAPANTIYGAVTGNVPENT